MNWYKTSQESKIMYIIRGIPGSGKSTLAKNLVRGGVFFETDDYWITDGEYKFNPEKIADAHQWNINRTRDAASKGISPVVIGNVNVEFWEMRPYVEIAKEYGYEVKFAEPDWHPELKTDEGKWNVEFLKGKNVHRVPDDVVENMANRFEYNPTIEKILKSKRPE